ncbi:2-iminoacetate synthase ThiH [Shewanella waksmanii]|uniref:2-iminoacetate synthase ThiH n=1 Tax=Shewanella waksmanii TaxID=213783 RepID=UPI0037370869
MSFVEQFSDLNRDALSMQLYSTTAEQVEAALINPRGDLTSLLALLSPAAEPYLEQMAQASVALTRQRFGAALNMYIPLYLSNLCANECDYCGFSMSNKLKRKTLTDDEISAEVKAIKQLGYDSILLVSGEHETKVGVDYFVNALKIIKPHFNYLAMEVQPLATDEYRQLKQQGLDAVMLYQETYQPQTYAQHHTRGKKRDFANRLSAPERVAEAGVDKIGLGVLLGLDDWRLDALMMGHQLSYLEQKYWRSRYSISLPRLRPCTGGITPKTMLTDRGLLQMIFAFRLFNHELEISLSTRETPALRDKLFALGVTHLSAGSSTQPGGYANQQRQLDQFEISDDRSPSQIANVIRSLGLTPVWKDWQGQWSC